MYTDRHTHTQTHAWRMRVEVKMFGVLQRKVKNLQSDCSLQDRPVMCEIKLKEPTDGSEMPEGGEGGGGEESSSQRSAASQQRSPHRQTQPHTGRFNTEKKQSPAQLHSELWQPQAYPRCAEAWIEAWQHFRGRLSVFQHFLKVICCFDFNSRSWTP